MIPFRKNSVINDNKEEKTGSLKGSDGHHAHRHTRQLLEAESNPEEMDNKGFPVGRGGVPSF